MTHVATAGTSSCATSAIGNFKPGQRQLNEEYKANPKSFKPPAEGLSVAQYYSQVLYPTTQALGRTHDLPFRKLMEDIEASSLKTKFFTAVINQQQYMADDHYWPKELNECGFKLSHKTKNSIGNNPNYVYVRNPNALPIEEGEF